MKKFILSILIISVLLVLITFITRMYVPRWVSPAWPGILVYFVLTNSILFWLFEKAKQRKMSTFANYFMMATFTKFILNLFIILAYAFYNRIDAVPFIILFFAYYVVFTAFEVKTVAGK